MACFTQKTACAVVVVVCLHWWTFFQSSSLTVELLCCYCYVVLLVTVGDTDSCWYPLLRHEQECVLVMTVVVTACICSTYYMILVHLLYHSDAAGLLPVSCVILCGCPNRSCLFICLSGSWKALKYQNWCKLSPEQQ